MSETLFERDYRAEALAVLDELRVLWEQASRSRRLKTLLSPFDLPPLDDDAAGIEGYTAGWALCVPGTFRDALDIDAVKGTQGWRFTFRKGFTFYDSREGYEAPVWSAARPATALCIQVLADASPMIPRVAFRRLEREGTAGSLRVTEERTVAMFDFVRLLITGTV